MDKLKKYCEDRGFKYKEIVEHQGNFVACVYCNGLGFMAGGGMSVDDAIDNLNIKIQSKLRAKIDKLCEKLYEIENMELP